MTGVTRIIQPIPFMLTSFVFNQTTESNKNYKQGRLFAGTMHRSFD